MRRRIKGLGGVHQAKDGRWIAQIDHRGQRHRRIRQTEREAWKALDEMQDLLERRISPGAQPTLQSYLEGWLASLQTSEAVRPSTWRGYEQKLRLYVYPKLGTVRLDRLDAEDFDKLFAGMKHLAPATVRQTRAILRAALGEAERRRRILENPIKHTRSPKVPNVERQTLTASQARVFLESLTGDRLEPLYHCAITLGLRQGELLGLRWKDLESGPQTLRERPGSSLAADEPHLTALDSRNGAQARTPLSVSILHVRQTVQRVDGAYYVGDPKTPRAKRDIPLPPHITAMLEWRRREQRKEFMAVGARPTHDLIFTTLGGNPMNGSYLTHDFQRRLAALGLPRVRFHDLRHAAASQLHALGFSPRDVMTILGHATYQITMERYAHSDQEQLAEKMRSVTW